MNGLLDRTNLSDPFGSCMLRRAALHSQGVHLWHAFGVDCGVTTLEADVANVRWKHLKRCLCMLRFFGVVRGGTESEFES